MNMHTFGLFSLRTVTSQLKLLVGYTVLGMFKYIKHPRNYWSKRVALLDTYPYCLYRQGCDDVWCPTARHMTDNYITKWK